VFLERLARFADLFKIFGRRQRPTNLHQRCKYRFAAERAKRKEERLQAMREGQHEEGEAPEE